MRLSTILLCLIVLLRSATALAQNPIHRCVGANGNPVFTDQPCDALHATSVTAAVAPVNDSHLAEPPPILCAANPQQLRQSVIDAFASRDANRMAGLMLWNGYGSGAAVSTVRSLTALMKEPLLDIDLPGDPAYVDNGPAPAESASSIDAFTADTPPPAPVVSDQLVLHMAGTTGDGNPRERRFSIVRRSGCLWLRNPD